MQNYLQHYGTKGMRWGVRRYTYDYGTLTDLGKRRYKTTTANMNTSKKILDASSGAVRNIKQMHDSGGGMKSRKKVNNDLRGMSDQDLKNRVNRMNLERQYSDLTANQVSRGRANVGAVIDGIGGTLAIASSALGIAIAIRELKKLPTK